MTNAKTSAGWVFPIHIGINRARLDASPTSSSVPYTHRAIAFPVCTGINFKFKQTTFGWFVIAQTF